MADAVLEVVLENLSSFVQKEFGLFLGVDEEIKRLSSTLKTIQAVLEDAEEKQFTNRPIKIWLQKLKDGAHVLEDILDECATEALRLEYQVMTCGSAKKVPILCFSSFSPKHVLFRHKIAKKMKNISQKLDDIAEERFNFHLREMAIIGRGAEVLRWRETTSIITEPQVYGREEEKEKIVDYLVDQASNFDDLLVYPIVGVGGLGKTTLAQFIFNDERVIKHFKLRIWICISDDFNLKRILKGIIESVTEHACEDMGLEPLQKRVQGLIERKRYLLVLDDVWDDNLEKWDKLKYVVACGSNGASIIITTRLAKVASIMGTIPPHQLSTLSEDDCWELFKYRAFEPDKGEPEELVAIGKEIVKKCGGVPLVAKALGGLLRFKSEEKEWVSIKESKLQSLPQEENSIMLVLRLSYLNLPVKLRQCFAFCAIFPKDHEICKPSLIKLWIANGFISSDGNLEVEDIGNMMWNELCWRSFFQDIKTDKFGEIRFKIHDLVHDLAQSVAEEVCCINGNNGVTSLCKRTHHLSVYTNNSRNQLDLLHLPQARSLKTFIMGESYDGPYLHLLCKCYSLRVLQRYCLHELSASIGHLKRLRYLNLSHGKFNVLPKSICSLWNLQILNLNYCRNLQRLPKKLTCLRGLQHLHLRSCMSLSSLPSGMGQLTFLKTLNVYFVDNKKGFLLAELEHLNLRGELHIKHLEKVRSVVDAKEAKMMNKNLYGLKLSWGKNRESELQENVEQILEALEPHMQLKKLAVEGYRGVYFPQWMGSATLKYLCSVELSGCINCLQLTSLGKLPSLNTLWLSKMNHVRYVDDESYRRGVATGFKALEYLSLEQLPNLERLSKEDAENIFPRLSGMFISGCPKFVLPSYLPSLRRQMIDGEFSEALLGSIHNLHNLESLHLWSNEELASFPDGMLRNLTSLKELLILGYDKVKVLSIEFTSSLNALERLCIERCNSLELITEQTLQGLHSLKTLQIIECHKLKLSGGFQYLTSLEVLKLWDCPEVEGFPSEAIQHLTALQSLNLERLPNLASLPDCFQNLSNLRSLCIIGCPKLMSLPMSIQGLCNLEELRIYECAELKKRCEKETGEDWHKIAHVRCVHAI